MRVRRIFSDMDGTLLNTKGDVSSGNAELMRQAGIPVTLVSARAPIEMKTVIDSLGLTGTQIGFNGGLIYRYKDNQVQVIREQAMETKDVRTILAYLYEHFPNLCQSYYDKDSWYSFKEDKGTRYETSITHQDVTLLDRQAYLNPVHPVFKIMLLTFDPSEMLVLKEKLAELPLKAASIQQSGPLHLEITHELAKKSSSLDYVMAAEGLTKKDLACFGDGHNDLPMFSRVATSIAMANATDDIKAKATYITKSNDEDGVGRGIWEYLMDSDGK